MALRPGDSPTEIDRFLAICGDMSRKLVNPKLVEISMLKSISLKFDDFQEGFIDFHIDSGKKMDKDRSLNS